MSGRVGLLGGLLAVQLLLVATLLLTDTGLGKEDQSVFLAIDGTRINGMEILDGEGNSVTLRRASDAWELRVSGADDAEIWLPADRTKVQSVLDTLLDLRAPWPVGTTAETRERFEVSDSAFQRKLTLRSGTGQATEVYLGTSPGYRRVHARVAGTDEVFSIDFANYQLPTAADDWLDSTLLSAEGEIAGIERRGVWTLTRDDEGWLVNGVAADQDAAAQLVERFDGLRVTGLVQMSPVGEVPGTGSPAAADFIVSDAEGSHALAVFGTAEDDEYVITSDRYPGGFTVAAYVAEQLMVDSEDLAVTVDEADAGESSD